MWGWKSRGGTEQRHMSLARIIQTPIKAFQSATRQRSGWGEAKSVWGTLERKEDDQKQGCITTRKQTRWLECKACCRVIWEVAMVRYRV